MSLSVLCVTRGAPRAIPFLEYLAELAYQLGAEFVIGADRCELQMEDANQKVVHLTSGGIVEHVLSEAVDACSGDYILRIDDDERCTPRMVAWLKDRAYEELPAWFFPRYSLWPDVHHLITSQPFFPDFQNRLAVRAKSKRPPTVHAGYPWPAYPAPCALEHHAFLVKTYAERQALTAHYETIRTGKLYLPADANVVAPEDWKVDVEALDDANQLPRALKFLFWRDARIEPPAELQAQLDVWMKEEGLS